MTADYGEARRAYADMVRECRRGVADGEDIYDAAEEAVDGATTMAGDAMMALWGSGLLWDAIGAVREAMVAQLVDDMDSPNY